MDGHRAPDAAVVPVDDGQVVTVGPVRRGLRAYLAVAGGFETPLVFGSRSSDVLSGLGPGRCDPATAWPVGCPVGPAAGSTPCLRGRTAAPAASGCPRVPDGAGPVDDGHAGDRRLRTG